MKRLTSEDLRNLRDSAERGMVAKQWNIVLLDEVDALQAELRTARGVAEIRTTELDEMQAELRRQWLVAHFFKCCGGKAGCIDDIDCDWPRPKQLV